MIITLFYLNFTSNVNQKLLFVPSILNLNRKNWGGRIRTYEWRSQSPQPYHLATPHYFENKNNNLTLGKKGFEPLTPWFVATCSSPLSYKPKL